jgi:flagellar biosynthetic protein FliS
MRGIAAYKNVSLQSSDQRKLVVMCFEALIRRQTSAQEAYKAGQFVEGTEHLRIAREIFAELLIGLDYDAAPEMTSNLGGLYHFCIRELALAGHESRGERIVECLKITQELYEGFSTAFGSEASP